MQTHKQPAATAQFNMGIVGTYTYVSIYIYIYIYIACLCFKSFCTTNGQRWGKGGARGPDSNDLAAVSGTSDRSGPHPSDALASAEHGKKWFLLKAEECPAKGHAWGTEEHDTGRNSGVQNHKDVITRTRRGASVIVAHASPNSSVIRANSGCS